MKKAEFVKVVKRSMNNKWFCLFFAFISCSFLVKAFKYLFSNLKWLFSDWVFVNCSCNPLLKFLTVDKSVSDSLILASKIYPLAVGCSLLVITGNCSLAFKWNFSDTLGGILLVNGLGW